MDKQLTYPSVKMVIFHARYVAIFQNGWKRITANRFVVSLGMTLIMGWPRRIYAHAAAFNQFAMIQRWMVLLWAHGPCGESSG